MSKKSKESKSTQQIDTLDSLLVALQKSLSRVNRASSRVDVTQARSLIVGDVAFNLACKCDLSEGDKLTLNDVGSVSLNLSGHINTDIGVVRLKEETDAATK